MSQTTSYVFAWTAFAAVIGLLIGSFVNVVVYRVPAGISVVRPGSACPKCGSAVRPFDNIPVLSWLVLGGRCRDCRQPIAARYPLVEGAVGVGFGLVAWWRWPALADAAQAGLAPLIGQALVLAAFLYLSAITAALALIDLETRTLPNVIVLPAYIVGGLLLCAGAAFIGRPEALVSAVIGGAGAFLLYLVLALAVPGGMGFGDVKLAGVLGMFLGFLGWPQLLVGVFAAFVLGGVFGIILMTVRRAGRRTGIPFGPWMLGGAWIGAVAGPSIVSAYLAILGRG
ncbi:A24 family peptidase [Cryocola sp. 340MFSha3.1]|uniref:prepilin peptidase n=1 Tax=Cryocola sp. 340MFSha3.1 TaxID=1169145 RepID=UPI0003745C4C|nr:A24 family peptidase [Cryocola sp. 340MFSha3.1]